MLGAVLGQGKTLDEAFRELAFDQGREARAWLQEVCAGTLRWKARLDFALDDLSAKKKPTGWLRRALLVAAYQLVATDIPAAPVISETVDLIKRKEGARPSGFANALLRRLAESRSEWREWKGKPGGAAGAGLPAWFWKKIVSEHGEAWAWQFGLESFKRPALWVRADGEEVLPEGAEPGPVEGSYRLEGSGDVSRLPGFPEGRFFVQDISNQALLREVTDLLRERIPEGGRLLDLCAAPGGKSAGMAWNGFQVIATDINADRERRLLETVGRVGREAVKVVAYREVEDSDGQYDAVWVDAPCSSSGIIRRHPDVRWHRRPGDLEGLVNTQAELIRTAWARVRPGGYLIYSVCSVFPEEGPGALKEAALGAEPVKTWWIEPQKEPHGDGFWAAAVLKPPTA